MNEIKRIPATPRMSAAVVHSDTVYLKGVTSQNGGSEITGQTQDVLDQIETLLAEAGSSKDKLIQVMIWLADITDFDKMNAVYDSWVVPDHQPVRACVEARLADPSLRVEIQVKAAV